MATVNEAAMARALPKIARCIWWLRSPSCAPWPSAHHFRNSLRRQQGIGKNDDTDGKPELFCSRGLGCLRSSCSQQLTRPLAGPTAHDKGFSSTAIYQVNCKIYHSCTDSTDSEKDQTELYTHQTHHIRSRIAQQSYMRRFLLTALLLSLGAAVPDPQTIAISGAGISELQCRNSAHDIGLHRA